MFEGMSDDEEDFQSVSHSTATSDTVSEKRMMPDSLNVFPCLNVCNRGAQQVPPTEWEPQQECVQCL